MAPSRGSGMLGKQEKSFRITGENQYTHLYNLDEGCEKPLSKFKGQLTEYISLLSGFNGQLFFLYDREAVTKEGDPPEDAIIYFYPPSASVESKVSICGQLVGVSNFLTTVLDFAPVLIKLKMEKVALCQSGKYTIALGGSSTEPDSLLLRQLNALFSVFSFYHGSFDNVKKFSKDHASFLSNMTIIWDCYLPFIRYYGDTLPAVFDPLPFLKTPKNSSGCFLKASHILEACQRRRHVLGGCILYKKSVLCTQLEPCITRRLLLFKPNQSHHPAKQVKTEINLPFGVRILHSFLALQEYERLMKELSRSPYNQNVTSQVEGLSASCAGNDQEKEADSAVGERFDGLLHKSVRRRIESESEGLSHARDTPKKLKPRKALKQRKTLAERSERERSVSSLDKEDSRSTLKHESPNKPTKKEAINEVPRGNQPLIDPPSKNQDEPLTTEDSPVEFKLEQEEHKPDKMAEVLPNVTENTENVADQSRHDGLCVTTLPQDKEKEGFLGNESSYPTCSNCADATTSDGYFYNSSSSEEDELTMDEVDVKDLRIITYSGKDYISYDIGRSEITSKESKEVVKEVCLKVVNELIEQVVSETEKGSTRCFQSGDASFHALPQDVLRHCPVATEPCEGQPSETKQNLLMINGHESQPVPSGLVLEKPINNGPLCDSAEGSFVEMPNGQHSGVVTIGNSNCNYSSNEDESEQNSEKIPVGVSETVPTANNFVSNTPKLENIDKQENERILTSVKTEETQSNGTHNSVCKNPKELLVGAIPTGAIIGSNDTSPNDCKWPGDVPKDSSSLGARTGSSITSSKDCEGTKESYTDSSSAGADVDSKDSSLKDHERPMKIAIDSPSAGAELDHNETFSQGSPKSEYHDSFEDLVTDGARSEESFLEESNRNLLQEYKILKAKDDSTINKYSTKNLNLPEEKHFKKMFFKDIVDGGNDDSKISSSSNDADGTRPGEVTPKSLDSGTNGYNKDSRTSSELSGNDAVLESLIPGCPGDCRSTLGDSGLCLLREAVDNPVTKTETEAVSNPSIPQDHHGDRTSLKLEDGPNCSSEEQVANETKETNDDVDHKVDCDEEMDDNAFQVDGMVHLDLYVQAHSNTVLILLAEDQLHGDHETIKALWKTSLNELGELEVRLNQCQENHDPSLKPEDYSYLVYDGLSNTTKGNLNEPVLQVDHMFCDTAKTVHEQFNNCSSLRSVTLRNSSSAVHCQRSLGQEVYFHKKGSFRSFLSSPSSRDPAFNLEKRAGKLLHKNHGVNVF